MINQEKSLIFQIFSSIVNLLIAAWVIIAFIGLMQNNVHKAVIYVFVAILCVLIVVRVYGSKCPSKNKCSHILPGKLTKLFKRKPMEKYKVVEIFTVFFTLRCSICGNFNCIMCRNRELKQKVAGIKK